MNKQEKKSTKEFVVEIIASIEQERKLPGDKLPSERELSKTYGISRSSVREGLHQLATMGYIETKQYIGSFVSSEYKQQPVNIASINQVFEVAHIKNLMEVRLILENNVIALAAARATNDDIQHMKEAVDKISKHENINEFYLADLDFHIALVKATHNEIFIELMKVIFKRIHQNKEFFLSSSLETRHKTFTLFTEIISSISRKDIDKATALYAEHLNDVEMALSKIM